MLLPKHTVQRRDILNYNGTVHNSAVYVRSGSLESVDGSTTGSVNLNFDALALRLRRVEVFHSSLGSDSFNFAIENRTPNTGSFFDPRSTIACYNDIPGSSDFTAGIDQIEDLYLLTDSSDNAEARLYIKFMPFGMGVNDFKYLLFFEACFLYIDKDGSING